MSQGTFEFEINSATHFPEVSSDFLKEIATALRSTLAGFGINSYVEVSFHSYQSEYVEETEEGFV